MMWKRYLFWFAHEHVDFRYPEFESLLSLFKIQMKWIEKPSRDTLYWVVELPSEKCALQLSSRSISLRWCIELWGRAKTSESLHKNLQHSLKNNTNFWQSTFSDAEEESEVNNGCPRCVMQPFFRRDKSFKITVETFCKHYSLSEKIKKIEAFEYIPMEGHIQLKGPDTELLYLEYYGLDQNNAPSQPEDVFLGRLIADGQRQLIKKLSLKTRKFIGNTSMDAQLSVLMANQLQIQPGDTVLDPFAGSGSLLVAAAEFGGYVWGSDIDFLMLHGKTRPTRVKQKARETDESIKANMCQYKTQSQYLDVMVSDFSLPIWKDSVRFDAIITDPPYGIREPTEKIGIERENYTLTPEQLLNHYPAKVDYSLKHILNDLLTFSAKHLEMGRRMVCWFPIFREDYKEENIPSNRCLKLVANSEQILSQNAARRLLTYEKISEPTLEECSTLYSSSVSEDDSRLKDPSPDKDVDFRERYFNSGEHTRKERKEQKALTKERGRIEKALRLKIKMEERLQN